MRIDHDGVSLVNGSVRPPCEFVQSLWNQPKIAAIRSIYMHPEPIPLAERQQLRQRIHRADGRGAQRDHHCSYISLAQLGLQRLETHAPAAVGRYARIVQLEHSGDALMRVVRLLRSGNAPPRSQLAGYPQRLQVGDGAAGGEVAQKIARPAKHAGDFGDGLNLHLGAGAAAVARMIVRVHRHGQRIGCPRHRMRRLQHLSRVKRVEIGIVVPQPVSGGS